MLFKLLFEQRDTWHAMCFKENNNGESKRTYAVTDIRFWGKTTVFEECSHLHYHIAYNHQTWKDGDLP